VDNNADIKGLMKIILERVQNVFALLQHCFFVTLILQKLPKPGNGVFNN